MPRIEGTWSTVEIGGKQAEVYEPQKPAEGNPVVLHLHGHSLRTLRDNEAHSRELERYGMRAVCPHGARSWWTDVVCPEFDSEITPLDFLRDHVIEYIRERWDVQPPGIGLAGVSMGGQGGLQLAYRYPREFPVVAAVSPAVDFQNLHGHGLPLDEMFRDKEAARQATALLLFHPLNWPRYQLIVCDPRDEQWFESADRLVMKLRSMGIPVETDLTTSHGGHGWEYYDAMASRVFAFLAEHMASIRG